MERARFREYAPLGHRGMLTASLTNYNYDMGYAATVSVG